MRTSDYDYLLPPHLVAQTPLEPRDSSRLMVLHRSTGHVEHRRFHELVEYLGKGDVLVFNDTRVIPARLHGRREDTGGRVELLLLRRLRPGVWTALGKPARRLKEGRRFRIDADSQVELWVEVLETGQDGVRTVGLSSEDGIEGAGQVALPPYIHTPLSDPEKYQTVYSRVLGSVAAPTAGLHFTPGLLESLDAKGVRQVYVTLHVGLDTFRPVRGEVPREHKIQGEYFQIGEDAAAQLNAARAEGRRVIAVGTTSVRLLEQATLYAEGAGSPEFVPAEGWADLYILPGHRFRLVDAMITNFHLPRTTLLMLVSAFAGRERILSAYQEAIAREYRFYSFGDGMLILP